MPHSIILLLVFIPFITAVTWTIIKNPVQDNEDQ